jgi:tetratricopeptide (TPR) repeat protein
MARIIQRGTFGSGGGMQAGGNSPLIRAQQALSQGRYDEAEQICRRRLERKPDDIRMRLLLSQALLQLQQVDEAAEQAQKVVDAQPNNADAQITLSAALSQSQSKAALLRAESAARKASALLPRSARPRVQLAEVYMAQRKLKEAKAAADEAVKLEANLPAAHLIRSVVLLQDSDAQGAADAARQAIRYDRSLAPAHYTLALALNQLKQPKEAEEALDRAQELNAPIPPATLLGLRGQIYVKQRTWPWRGLGWFKKATIAYAAAQSASGRPRFLALPLGFLITFFSMFGKWTPLAIAIVAAAILFGLGAIPVAGRWIVAAVLLALIIGMVYGFVRSLQSGAISLGRFASTTGLTLVTAVILIVVGGAAFLAVWVPAGALAHSGDPWRIPTGIGVGVLFGLVTAGLAGRSVLKLLRASS